MESFNLNDIEQIMTFYLIFNFVILACLIYIVISLIFRRSFLIVLIVFTSIYIFNSFNFIMSNIYVVKKVLKIG